MTNHSLSLLAPGFGLGGYIARGVLSQPSLADFATFGENERWMATALVTAMDGIGRTSPNPSVGCVLVKNGLLLGRAATEAYGSLHAERAALNGLAKGLAAGADCYVTLEPCAGLGHQPPCTDALIEAGVRRVIVGARDPHPKAAGLGLERLKAAGIEVHEGVLRREAEAWHFPFLAYQEKKAPILIGKWAQTLDGHLADDAGRSQWISGERSRAYTHWLRQKYDAILIGAGTLLRDEPSLTVRHSPAPIARHPYKIIYDPSGRLACASARALAHLFAETRSEGPAVAWCVSSGIALPASLSSYKDRIDVISLDSTHRAHDIGPLAAHSYRARLGRELQSILIEGGSQLLTLLMREDALDALHVFVRAGVLGGSENRIGRLKRGENPSLDLMSRADYQLVASQTIDDDVVLEAVHRRFAVI